MEILKTIPVNFLGRIDSLIDQKNWSIRFIQIEV